MCPPTFLCCHGPATMLGQAVSGLSVESYLQLHKALTKQSDCVQSVTPIEECYYKIGDLRQLLVLHGLTASKFNKSELLASLKGRKLINLACSSSSGSNGNLPLAEQQNTDTTSDPDLPFSAAEMCSVLGITGPSSDDPQPLKFLQLGPAAPFPVSLPLPASGPVAAAAPGPPAPHVPALASARDQAAAQPTSCDHNDAAPHKQQQQPIMQQPPSKQQNAITSAQQVQHAPQAQQQQQQQQQHIHAMACPIPPAAAQAANQADPLHQLLATLLTQHTAGPAAGGMLQVPTTQLPQQAAASSMPTTGDLLQQLLAQSASRPHTSTHSLAMQSAAAAALPQPAMIAATLPTAAHPTPSTVVQQGTTADPPTEFRSTRTPEPSHTPWLKPQLEWFLQNGLRLQQPLAAAAAVCANKGCGGLLGHRVGFMLLEDMQVAGPRNVIFTLPPGFYEGMAVKYLGGSCQSEVCEMNCPGQHQFYRARILPPRALPEPGNSAAAGGELAAGLAQAHAATTGRPVLLILDLHPRLRGRSLEGLLQISTADQLQDAWVLLEHDGDDVGAASLQEPQADEVLPAEPAAQRKGRKPGRPAGSQNKRART